MAHVVAFSVSWLKAGLACPSGRILLKIYQNKLQYGFETIRTFLEIRETDREVRQ